MPEPNNKLKSVSGGGDTVAHYVCLYPKNILKCYTCSMVEKAQKMS